MIAPAARDRSICSADCGNIENIDQLSHADPDRNSQMKRKKRTSTLRQRAKERSSKRQMHQQVPEPTVQHCFTASLGDIARAHLMTWLCRPVESGEIAFMIVCRSSTRTACNAQFRCAPEPSGIAPP